MTYTVVARRSNDGWWALSCADVRGAHSQVRKLGGAEEVARDAIAGVLGVDISEIEVALEVNEPT